MPHLDFREKVITSFERLYQSLNNLATHIKNTDGTLPGWFNCSELLSISKVNFRNDVAKFLLQLDYVDGQDPKEILLGPGIFPASIKTMDAIHAVNDAKMAFKQAMLELRQENIKVLDPKLSEMFENLLKSRSITVSNYLNKFGLARLHLKQCYRIIPTFDSKPESLSWTWANTRSIRKISISDARSMLLNSKYSDVESQLQKLQQLQPNEKLAIVQELAPHLRVNVLMPNKERKMIKGSMPIFYLVEGLDTLPRFKAPDINKPPKANRQIRNDVRLGALPFLPAIRAHRYVAIEA